MRNIALTAVAVALVLGLVGTGSLAAAPDRAADGAAAARTLRFEVRFSPFSLIPVNPARDPDTGFGLGDELTFHDLLFADGQQVGDQGGSCVLVDARQALASCTEVIRLPGGTLTAQFLNGPPAQKALAITGGTGAYRAAGGEGTLVEFGPGTGSLTLHLLALPHDVD
jgi:hypothetical protein